MLHKTLYTVVLLFTLIWMPPTSNSQDLSEATPSFRVLEDGGTGPFPAIAAEDLTLPGMTIFRPKDLGPFGEAHKLPILLWGNGACANTTFEHKNFLNEIASHGYVILGIGLLDEMMERGEASRQKTKPDQLIAALDWILAENASPESVYFGKVDTDQVAAMGMSCGGLQAIAIADDPRISTVIICNSGVLPEPSPMEGMPPLTKETLKKFHSPVLYIMGGPSDIAYNNAMDDFKRVDHVPIAMTNLAVGHGGTYAQPHGGEFTRVALAWLNWQLKGQTDASKMFLGENSTLKLDPDWNIETKNFDAEPRDGEMANAEFGNIKNDIFWDTKNGEPIYSQGGGIFTFKDPETQQEKYYWYGVRYDQAERYREDPSVTFTRGNRFNSVTCYTSTDLVNWESEGDALTQEESRKNGGARGWPWMGRLGVAYNEEADKYVMVIQYGAGILFAVADKPAGPFEWHARKDMTETIGTPNTGDQTVFTDEDTGKSYLVYSYGQGRNRIYISEIGLKDGKFDLLDCTEVYKGSGREGNCMFKYNGKYYLAASQLYGWDSSFAYYLVADDIRGPYLPENDMKKLPGAEDDYAHVTQTGFFVTVKGSQETTVIYCGDRWAAFAGNGLGYNQWCPLSFEGETPYFNSLNSWNLNAETGQWQVADDNNYVKNPSFEADRKDMPSPVKPVQTRILGWETSVIKGTQISLDPGSPMLNFKNTAEDRKQVIGERSLNMSDQVDFTRKVHQKIASSPYVELEDGYYTLTAKVKNSEGFEKLEMYAKSDDKDFSVTIDGENSTWKSIQLNRVLVSGNKVEIGFLVDGKADSFCLVDDVSFVKAN